MSIELLFPVRSKHFGAKLEHFSCKHPSFVLVRSILLMLGVDMCLTFLNPKTCGFGKVAAIFAAKKSRELKRGENEGKAKFGARVLQERHTTFRDIFQENDDFSMDFNDFNKKFSALQEAVSKWSPRKKQDKETYLKEFSVESWNSLSGAKKREHTLFDCKGCHQNFPKAQSLFPVKSPRLKSKEKENPFVISRNLREATSKQSQLLNKTAIKETARCLYDSINSAFTSVSGGVTFAEALTKVPDTNLKLKPTQSVAKQIRRNILIEAKNNTEEKWKETSLIR